MDVDKIRDDALVVCNQGKDCSPSIEASKVQFESSGASPISKELIETDMREELGVLSEMGSGTEEESSESESTNYTDSAAVV